jgi:chorismate mutase / prephenate dehydratase
LILMDGRFKIEKLRKKIDRIDTQLVSLLLTRLNLAHKIGMIKQNSSIPIEDSDRETAIIHRLQQLSSPSLASSTIERIWREIFLICREIQQI